MTRAADDRGTGGLLRRLDPGGSSLVARLPTRALPRGTGTALRDALVAWLAGECRAARRRRRRRAGRGRLVLGRPRHVRRAARRSAWAEPSRQDGEARLDRSASTTGIGDLASVRDLLGPDRCRRSQVLEVRSSPYSRSGCCARSRSDRRRSHCRQSRSASVSVTSIVPRRLWHGPRRGSSPSPAPTGRPRPRPTSPTFSGPASPSWRVPAASTTGQGSPGP